MEIREIPFTAAAGWMILPPRPGVCQECATSHQAHMPHNLESLYYQTKFHLDHGRFPAWLDAMSHCTNDVRWLWIDAIEKMGIQVIPRFHNWGNPEVYRGA